MGTPDRSRFEAWQRDLAAAAQRCRTRADQLAHTTGPHAARWVPRLQREAEELERLAEQLAALVAKHYTNGSPT